MATVLDIAEYILEKEGSMTAMKLQKLIYYCQAWGLVWDEAPLFNEPIQAWANGPVSPDLYRQHRGQFDVSPIGEGFFKRAPFGDATALTAKQVATVGAVLKHYVPYSGHQLSEITHREDPWRRTRHEAGLSDGDRGVAEITKASMHEYYDSL